MYQERLLKADINISASGDNTIIVNPAENPAEYIAIDFIMFMPQAGVTIQLKDGATAYGGPLVLTANQGVILENSPKNEHGIITLSSNKNFVINLSGAVQVSGFVRYRLMGSN